MATKDKVLKFLYENQGKPVSGELLAQKFGVSRAAIWKSIKTLREQGCEIVGTTNGGYLINGSHDLFSTDIMREFINDTLPELANNHIECFKEIDSTNNYAKKIISEAGPLRNEVQELTQAGAKLHKAIIVAETQTAGRGRSGRTFVSPAKTGIYLSLIYAPKGGVKQASRITAFTAVAICRIIRKLYDVIPSIKWINDIFLNGKKIGGVLTEGTANFETGLIESAIIGIGINIQDNAEAFDKELSKIAGSILSNGKSSNITRLNFASQIANEVFKVLEEDPAKVIEEYKLYSFIIGREVEVHSIIDSDKGNYLAKVVDIDDDAGLVVQDKKGNRRTLISGEVSLISQNFVD